MLDQHADVSLLWHIIFDLNAARRDQLHILSLLQNFKTWQKLEVDYVYEQRQTDCKVKTDYLGYGLILLMIIYAGQTIVINNENQHWFRLFFHFREDELSDDINTDNEHDLDEQDVKALH